MKVIGYFQKSFKADDGKSISGVNIFLSYPITKNGMGEGVDRVFVSDQRLANSGYYPSIGDEVTVLYNRFGKVESISVNR